MKVNWHLLLPGGNDVNEAFTRFLNILNSILQSVSIHNGTTPNSHKYHMTKSIR